MMPNFNFYYELQLLRLETENYFIHMAVAAILTVFNLIEPIFVHIFKRTWSYFGNGITNVASFILKAKIG